MTQQRITNRADSYGERFVVAETNWRYGGSYATLHAASGALRQTYGTWKGWTKCQCGTWTEGLHEARQCCPTCRRNGR